MVTRAHGARYASALPHRFTKKPGLPGFLHFKGLISLENVRHPQHLI
jgi:hypothetical protein